MDPRIARTRALLQDALLALAKEKSLDDITVADIADRATINRSTFYQHYADKETLLADALDEQARKAGADLTDLALIELTGDVPAVVLTYVEHLADNAALYRLALGERGAPIAAARLHTRINAIVTRGVHLHEHELNDLDLPVEVAAASITGSLLGVITTWLSMEPMPPADRAARWIWQLLVPSKAVVCQPDADPDGVRLHTPHR